MEIIYIVIFIIIIYIILNLEIGGNEFGNDAATYEELKIQETLDRIHRREYITPTIETKYLEETSKSNIEDEDEDEDDDIRIYWCQCEGINIDFYKKDNDSVYFAIYNSKIAELIFPNSFKMLELELDKLGFSEQFKILLIDKIHERNIDVDLNNFEEALNL